MSTHAAQLLEQRLFTAIKTQIISLATPLYGTRSEDASKVYDVVTYSMTTNDGGSSNDSRSTFNTASTSSNNDGEERIGPTYGVALILYTGPSSSPFTSWTLISHVEDQPDIITGANCLLEDLRKGMGGVISVCMQTGNWKTKHESIPNIAGVSERGQEGEEEVEHEHRGDGVTIWTSGVALKEPAADWTMPAKTWSRPAGVQGCRPSSRRCRHSTRQRT